MSSNRSKHSLLTKGHFYNTAGLTGTTLFFTPLLPWIQWYDEFIVYKLFLMVGSKAGYEWAYYVVKLSARVITSYPDTAPLEMR